MKPTKTYSRTDSATYSALLTQCKEMAFTKDGLDGDSLFYMVCRSNDYAHVNVCFVRRTLGKRVSYLVGGFVSYRDGGLYRMTCAREVACELRSHQKRLRADFNELAASLAAKV